MRINWLCLILFWNLSVGTALAVPITLALSSGNNSNVAALGTFTYETTATPARVNLGGMNNAVYTPTSWQVAMTNSFIGNATFANTLAGQTAEWCVGICTFSAGPQVRLNLRDGTGLLFHVSFALNQQGFAPPAFNQIGAFTEALYRDDRAEGTTRLQPFNTATLRDVSTTATVPEPATWVLLTVCGVIWGLLYWKEVKRP